MASEGKDVSPFGDLLGVEWVSTEPDRAQARIEVRADLTQPYGYLHGGVIMAIVDELCSRSTLMQVISEGMVALGQSMEISMVRTVASGSVTVEARARHQGRRTWVWGVEASDDEGRLCALAKMTVAVRRFEQPA